MYSKYTEGTEGVTSTEEGQVVTIVDIPLVLRSNHQSAIPPLLEGMRPFVDGSPDNYLSCEPEPLIVDPPNQSSTRGNNVLIDWSLSDIARGQRSPWALDHSLYDKRNKGDKPSQDSLRELLLPLNQLEVSPSHAHSDQAQTSERQESEEDEVWYDSTDGTLERTVEYSPRSPQSRGPYKGEGHRKEQEVPGGEGRGSRQNNGRHRLSSLEELTKINKVMTIWERQMGGERGARGRSMVDPVEASGSCSFLVVCVAALYF